MKNSMSEKTFYEIVKFFLKNLTTCRFARRLVRSLALRGPHSQAYRVFL